MTGPRWFDMQHHEISAADANRLLLRGDERVIPRDTVDAFTVSTVFLVLDHRILDDGGLPLLYETMIFGRGRHAT